MQNIQSSIEEQATGCVGASSYRKFAKQHGYDRIEVLDWTSSAGDWQFIISQDAVLWRVLSQENNYPRGPGFSHTISDEEFVGTADEVLKMLYERYYK